MVNYKIKTELVINKSIKRRVTKGTLKKKKKMEMPFLAEEISLS